MKKVLVVDDAAFMRLSLKVILAKGGFEVIGEAGNGEEAIEKYKILKPDIVTLDITMPGMSGVEVIKEIKKIDKNAKIIMISAMGQERLIRESIINGARDFIVKPFKEDHIIKALGKL
jgi:two-component system chemotaxis response regulator CheY